MANLFPNIPTDPELKRLLDYATTNHDPAEEAFKEYEHERWVESPERWSPLINLKQLAARPDEPIKWYCPDWIPLGAKTILSAEPKAGKSLLLFHILKAVTEGGKFLGKQCHPARVLYLSELTELELKHQLKEVPGLLGSENFYVLLPEECPPRLRTWEDMIEFAAEMLDTTKSKILVVDTFGSLAKLPQGGENDSATIQNTINKLNVLFQNRHLAVVLTHHNRKKSEDKNNPGSNLSISSARGSSAFVGGGGHLVFMNNPVPGGTRRDFMFFGRYLQGEEKHLRLENGRYEEIQGMTFGGQGVYGADQGSKRRL